MYMYPYSNCNSTSKGTRNATVNVDINYIWIFYFLAAYIKYLNLIARAIVLQKKFSNSVTVCFFR